MTLAAPSTISLMAASLLLAAGVSTAVVTAEPAPIPTPAPVQPIPPPSALDQAMELPVTLDFQDTSLLDTIAFFQRVTNQNFVIDPLVAAAPRPVTLKVDKMSLRNVLAHVERLTGTTHVIRDGAYVLQLAGAVQPPKPAAGIDLIAADADVRNRMDQRVTFDFQDAPLTDIIAFLRQVGAVNCVVMPSAASGSPTVTLRVKEMTLQDALKWMCQITGTSVRYVDQALVFDAAPANGANPAPQVRPANPPVF
jgi:type II secretory pathway component GspD/PulD (secretin)